MNALLQTFSLTTLDVPMILVGVVLFVALWQLLAALIFRPFLELIEERERATTGAHDQAREIRRKAQQMEERLQEALLMARVEENRIRDGLLSSAKAEANDLIAKADTAAREKVAAIRSEIARQLETSRAGADDEVEVLSNTIAEKIQRSLAGTLNSFILVFAVAISIVLMNVAPVYAEAEHGAHSGSGLGVYWLNFSIFAAIVFLAVRKPFVQGMHGRATFIADAISVAEKEIASAEALRLKAEKDLARLTDAVAELRDSIKRQTTNEVQQIKLAAEEKMRRIERQADEMSGVERRAAERTIKEEMISRAFDLAEMKLASRINAEQDAAFRDAALKGSEQLVH